MWRSGKLAATPEYETAKTAVWWDMHDCPIPEGYDARRVRASIERELKKLGYFGPVSITAYGDQKQITDDQLLRRLSSTGVAVAHTIPESRCSVMFSDMVEWRDHNPPPATMMLISDQMNDVFSWELARLQQDTKYNFFLAYSFRPQVVVVSVLLTHAKWLWEEILNEKHEEEIICSELSAMFNCKSCEFYCQSLGKFRKHLSSREHALEEARNPSARQLVPVTRKWGRNYSAKPEYATAKIAVWWDIHDCPIPEGYDVRRVRASLEGEFKKLGYSGPVSITAYGDLTQTPDHLLRGLSSTGVDLVHAISVIRYTRMSSDMVKWKDLNPPPATVMLISDRVETFFQGSLARQQQETKYNLFLGYSFRPYKMSVLVTSAEWLWESLLAVSETRRHLIQRCSERGEESTGTIYCKSCFCDCKSLDNFIKHLSTKKHACVEGHMYDCIRLSEYNRHHMQWIKEEDFPRKRLRKAFQTSFRLLHNHLRLTNYGGARRSSRKNRPHDQPAASGGR